MTRAISLVLSQVRKLAGTTEPDKSSDLELVQRFAALQDSGMHGTVSSVAVHDSLVVAVDCLGYIHCLEARTGKKHWSCDTFREIFSRMPRPTD